MPNFTSFYRGKRVLVTGHTGFVGGWLTAWLKLLGANVIGFALPPKTRPNLFDAAMLDRNIISIFGDVRDRGALTTAFAQQQPEIVIHLAAQAPASRAHDQPVETYATNAMGTVYVLEEARYARSLRALLILTGEVICGDRAHDAPAANDQSGSSLHGSSLACAGLATTAYRESFFNQPGSAAVASVRADNIIGGGDWEEDRLVPDIARGISSGEPVSINNSEQQISWQHVLDPVRGCLLLAQRLYEDGRDHACSWTFSSDGPTISAEELAKRMIALWREDALSNPPAPASRKALPTGDGTNHLAKLAWVPLLNLDKTVEWTVEWYRAYYQNPALAWPITEAQIQRFTQIAGESAGASS
jgi:CDP-glucose 4,6-dehydratase